MDKSLNCIDCNSTIVLPDNQITIRCQLHKSNTLTSPMKRNTTRLDEVNSTLNKFITEVTNPIDDVINDNHRVRLSRNSSMRSSKSSQNIEQYQRSRTQQQLDYYQQILLNSQTKECELYYSFLRFYVDSMSVYSNQEIWHMVNHHNPRIKQFNQGLLIRTPNGTWFILVTGSIFINGKLYLPHSCFGQNQLDSQSTGSQMQKNSALLINGTGSRSTECLTLENSELLLIDYHCNGLSTTNQANSANQYVNNSNNHLLNNHHLHQLRQQANALNQQQQLNHQYASSMHSSVGTPTNCPLNNTNSGSMDSSLLNFGAYNASYTNLINNLNNTYLNNYHTPLTTSNGTDGSTNHLQQQQQFTSNLNHNLHHHQCHITPHQRAASMYSCHSDTTTATNTTSSDSELDLNALTEQLVDDEDDDLNEEELRKLAMNTDELLFGNHHVLNNNNLTNNLISSHKPPSNRLLHLRQVLEKNSLDRTDQDNETILNYINSLSAFDKYDQLIKKQLASVMILAIIESPFTVILTHNETLDSFCCLIHGSVEHVFSNEETLNKQNQNSKILQPGDVFGITEPSLENLYFKGIMKTLTPFCWFLCVTQHDFYKILSSTQMEVVKYEENGQVTLVTEIKKVDNKKEKIILRGTPEKLLTCVFDNHTDLHFIDDFLLTYRVFMPESRLIEEDSINNNEQIDQTDHQSERKLNLNIVKISPHIKFKHLVKGFEYISNKLLNWFEDDNLRDKIIRIVLMWVNNYYLDFELASILDKDANLNAIHSGQLFLDQFEHRLATNVSLLTQLRLLHIGLSTKAKVRHINLTRNNRQDDLLNFTILGGYERGYGIFVSKVDQGSKIDQLGLRKGDQILEVNGINFAIITHTKALDVLRSTTHLQMTVKYNPFMFNEMISVPEGGKPRKPSSLSSAMLQLPTVSNDSCHTTSTFNSNSRKNSNTSSTGNNTPTSSNLNSIVNSNTLNTSGGKWQFSSNGMGSGTKIKRAIPRFANFLSKHLNFTHDDSSFQNDEIDFAKPLAHRSHSNPDLHKLAKETICQCGSTDTSNLLLNNQFMSNRLHQPSLIQTQPQSVIRVFNATTGDYRYLFVHPETTAKEVVMVSVGEFGLCNNQSGKSSNEVKSSLNYSLYEVSVVPEANNTIKQKRLPDELNNLADRASFHSRYYIKESTLFSSSSSSSNQTTSSNPNQLSDEVSSEILKECPMPITLLSLNTAQIGIELTLQDFAIFSSIEPQEFIFDIFEMKTDDLPNSRLMEFELLSNKEMFWVINEILSEVNLVKRVKIIKYFIKTANICRNLHNYNSMFAILSGLGHGSVQRLKQTWEKLSTKYHKILKALQLLMDPSRNMMHYRREISTRSSPIIPFYPIVKKDLTFINLAHMTIADDGLVNFDKMRMISKEVRSIKNMATTPYMMPSAANNNINTLNITSSVGSTGQTNENSKSMCVNKNCILLNKQQPKDYQNLQAIVSEITGEVPLPPPPPTIVSSSSVNAKRIFEESLMKKKVRHYLELCFSKINYDEDCLLGKSVEIELGPNANNLNQSQHSQSNASIKSQSKDQLSINTGSTTTVNSSSTNGTNNKLQGSPTLSSTSSSSSSGRLKFGAESPHQLRKLMSLSEVVDSGKSSHKSNHSHGLGQFLNYHHSHSNNHHNINQHQSTNANQTHQQSNNINNGRFIATQMHSANSNQQINNLAQQPQQQQSSHQSQQTQHPLNNSNNNFAYPPTANHLRNITEPLNCNNILLNTVSFNAPLSIESSSVTSLRRLEQLQQLKKFQENYYFPYNSTGSQFIQHSIQQPQQQSTSPRPPLPNYEDALLMRKIVNMNNTLGRSSNNSSTNSNRTNDNDKVSAV